MYFLATVETSISQLNLRHRWLVITQNVKYLMNCAKCNYFDCVTTKYINMIELTTPTVCSDNNKKLIQMIQDCHTITRQHLLHMTASSGGRRNYNKSKRLWQKYKFNVERSLGWLNGSTQHWFFWGAIYFRPLNLNTRVEGDGCTGLHLEETQAGTSMPQMSLNLEQLS